MCFQVLEISSYRGQLYDYLRSRMMAVAPNLTILMGELVGARLVAQAGMYLHWGFNVVSWIYQNSKMMVWFKSHKFRGFTSAQ